MKYAKRMKLNGASLNHEQVALSQNESIEVALRQSEMEGKWGSKCESSIIDNGIIKKSLQDI